MWGWVYPRGAGLSRGERLKRFGPISRSAPSHGPHCPAPSICLGCVVDEVRREPVCCYVCQSQGCGRWCAYDEAHSQPWHYCGGCVALGLGAVTLAGEPLEPRPHGPPQVTASDSTSPSSTGVWKEVDLKGLDAEAKIQLLGITLRFEYPASKAGREAGWRECVVWGWGPVSPREPDQPGRFKMLAYEWRPPSPPDVTAGWYQRWYKTEKIKVAYLNQVQPSRGNAITRDMSYAGGGHVAIHQSNVPPYVATPMGTPWVSSISTPRDQTVPEAEVPVEARSVPEWAGPAWANLGGRVLHSLGLARTAAPEDEEDVFASLELPSSPEGSDEVPVLDEASAGVAAARAAAVRTGRSPTTAMLLEADAADGDPEALQRLAAQQGANAQEVEVGVIVAAGALPLARFPVLQLVYNPHIREHIILVLQALTCRFWICAYCFDDHQVVEALIGLLRREGSRKVEGRLLVDLNQTKDGSCARQQMQLARLIEQGAKVRVRKPGTQRFAISHEKTYLADNYYICGSANCTGNSFDNCEEAILCTSAADIVGQACAHFVRIWADAKPLTLPQLRTWEEERRHSRSQSAERRRGPPRSRMSSVPEAEAGATGAGSRESATAGSAERARSAAA